MPNPWSILNYARKKKLLPYWINTGSNQIIKTALSACSLSFSKQYEKLLQKNEVTVNANLETSYFEDVNDTTLWALFINSGYLTIKETVGMNGYVVAIPNEEVEENFKDLTAHNLHINNQILDGMKLSLTLGDVEGFLDNYQMYLLEVASYHDLKDENSYQTFRSAECMLMLGLCAYLYDSHKITSNREAGSGRYDILLESKKNQYPSYVLEFKYTKDAKQNLHKLAQEALQQITSHHYGIEVKNQLIYIGLAHRQKEVDMAYQMR